jgi:hypothetical protein
LSAPKGRETGCAVRRLLRSSRGQHSENGPCLARLYPTLREINGVLRRNRRRRDLVLAVCPSITCGAPYRQCPQRDITSSTIQRAEGSVSRRYTGRRINSPMHRTVGFGLWPTSRSMWKRKSRSLDDGCVATRTVFLAGQAARCRRLAQGLSDETVRQKLLALAAKYETKDVTCNHAA